MSLQIDIPSPFGPAQTAAWFAAWRAAADAPRIQLASWNEGEMEPAGATVLAAALAHRRGLRLETLVGNETRHPELHAILTERAAESAARESEARLEAQMPEWPSSLRRFARNVLEELGVNIVQHSRAPETGFVAMRAWGGSDPRIQLAAADAGVGFLKSFQRHPEFAGRVQDEGEALQLALHTGLSASDSAANSGFGLGMLRFLSDQLGADLWVASGSALLHRRTVSGQRATSVRPIAAWRGSWLCMDAPISKR